ncbi:MAG: hypothetical protein WDM79_15950 [Terricaulis sp.]
MSLPPVSRRGRDRSDAIAAVVKEALAGLGRIGTPEIRVACVFGATGFGVDVPHAHHQDTGLCGIGPTPASR